MRWRAVLACACACLSAGAAGALWAAREELAFAAESGVSLGDAARRGAAERQVRAELRVSRAWPADHHAGQDVLLHLHVSGAREWSRGARAHGGHAQWAARGALPALDGEFYAVWRAGDVRAALLPRAAHAHHNNYRRALLSLLQFQVPAGDELERNETDSSGACRVLYEPAGPLELRKIKSGCVWAEGGGDGGGGGAVETRRVTRVTLAAGAALHALHAEEVHSAGGELGAGLRARAYTSLRALGEPRAAPAPPAALLAAASLEAALAALPPALAPHTLPLQPAPLAPEEGGGGAEGALEDAVEALVAAGPGEGAGAGGGAEHAAALLAALPAARTASRAQLAALLRREDLQPLLAELVRLCGLAGTRAAHEAAAELLPLRARDVDTPRHALAAVYLAALAHAPRPHEWVVREVARVGAGGGAGGVARAALCAAAAAAAGAPATLAANVRDTVLRALLACKQDEECECARLAALGNLRREDTVDPLLVRALAGAPRVQLAALDALHSAPADALRPEHVRRLLALAAPLTAPVAPPPPLEVRAAALDLALVRMGAARAPHAALLAAAAAALHAHGPTELRRVLWQRVRELPALRALLPLLPTHLRTWHALALHGTSSVMSREAGWAVGPAEGAWRAQLDSVQVAAGGMLRRGAVRLALLGADNRTLPALHVQLWARGMSALAGAPADDEPADELADEPAAGGLALAVAGVQLPSVTLFSGQAELLGLVWAGAGSEPTPVVRALVPLAQHTLALPLVTGAMLEVSASAAAALALDAHAQVSLWSRTARTRMSLRAALVSEARLSVAGAGAALRAAAAARSEPRLRIAADLDFYDGVSLCVRVAVPDHQHLRNVSLWSGAGALHLAARQPHAGRTLALDARNAAACRALAPAPHEDD